MEEGKMKICWDNLEGLIFRQKDSTFYDRRKKKRYYIVDECQNCREEFLYPVYGRKNPQFCSPRCTGIGTKEKAKKTSLEKYGVENPSQSKESRKKIGLTHKGKVISEEVKKKISRSRKGKGCKERNCNYGKHLSDEIKEKISKSKKKWFENNLHPYYGRHHSEETIKRLKEINKKEGHPNWKGGYDIYLPLYDTYASQIDWVEECRRNKEDPNILEVKCTYCGRWFVPSRNSIGNRIQYLKGNEKYSEYRLYCSDSCKKECPIYYKSAQTLMKEDAIRAGRLNWIELNREVQPELRQMVMKRDNHECQKCGSIEHLHCHHILPASTEPIESADVDNCITLCKECHKEVHKKDGCKYGQLKICLE